MIEIHAIQTGTVQIKAAQRHAQAEGLRQQMNVLLDAAWTPPLPVYAWAIRHPEGVIVVDTGETARTGEAGYFPRWHPYFRFALRVSVAPEEEIGPQLRALGMPPEEVRTVVLTHLHTDHAGGLHHFPESEILASAADLERAKGVAGRLQGYLPHRWPAWFAPAPLAFTPAPYGSFDAHRPLTQAGDVVVVPTPGHTEGHASVVVERDGVRYFLAGDTSYTEQALLDREVDGVSTHPAQAMETMERILRLARDHPTVYLPTHDPAAAERLAAGATLQAAPAAPTSAPPSPET